MGGFLSAAKTPAALGATAIGGPGAGAAVGGGLELMGGLMEGEDLLGTLFNTGQAAAGGFAGGEKGSFDIFAALGLPSFGGKDDDALSGLLGAPPGDLVARKKPQFTLL